MQIMLIMFVLIFVQMGLMPPMIQKNVFQFAQTSLMILFLKIQLVCVLMFALSEHMVMLQL